MPAQVVVAPTKWNLLQLLGMPAITGDGVAMPLPAWLHAVYRHRSAAPDIYEVARGRARVVRGRR
jgi:hypothetical protein